MIDTMIDTVRCVRCNCLAPVEAGYLDAMLDDPGGDPDLPVLPVMPKGWLMVRDLDVSDDWFIVCPDCATPYEELHFTVGGDREVDLDDEEAEEEDEPQP